MQMLQYLQVNFSELLNKIYEIAKLLILVSIKFFMGERGKEFKRKIDLRIELYYSR